MITLQELCFSKHKYILLRAVQTGNGEYLRKALVFFPLDCNAITFPLVSESMMIPVMFLKEEVLSRPYFKAEVDRVLKESLDRQVSLVEIAIAQQQIEILKVIVSLHRKDSFSCLVNPWNIMQVIHYYDILLEFYIMCMVLGFEKRKFGNVGDPRALPRQILEEDFSIPI